MPKPTSVMSLTLTFLPEDSPAELEYVERWNKMVLHELLYPYVLVIGFLTVYNLWKVHMKQ
jgi:hypothetical protein